MLVVNSFRNLYLCGTTRCRPSWWVIALGNGSLLRAVVCLWQFLEYFFILIVIDNHTLKLVTCTDTL